MKKRITLTFMVLLMLLGGVSIQAQTVNLPIKGGYNWQATDGVNNWDQGSDVSYTTGTLTLKDNAWGNLNHITASAVGGSHWAATFNTGETHTFTVTLDAESSGDLDLHIVAVDADNNTSGILGGDFSAIAVNNINTTSTKTLTLEVTNDYAAVYLYSTSDGSHTKTYKITSITRTVTGVAPSVAAPTIAPATGTTYAGNLSVTITPGEGNDHVKYSISGSNEDVTDQTITTATVINLTGTGTITVTATGYDDAYETNASTTTECEYSYSVPDGKTNVTYGIPHIVNTAMYTYTFDNNDYIDKSGFDGQSNPGYDSPDDSYSAPYNLWLHNDDYKGNDWDCQLTINLDKSEWPTGTKAILHFAVKASDGFECKDGSKGMQIALQRNSDPWTGCGEFTDGIIPTSTWTVYDLETTVTADADCEKLYFNCGMFKGDFRFDDIILYKVEEAATGGSNEFTSDEQVANIASSAFSGLNEGDYICADVTGTPETIKIACNGTDYALTQFNGGTLWGIKATAEMVAALQANNSQFKGHDLTLNDIAIYQTKAINEGDNNLTVCNNVFVELTRSFVANTWNTVCLPFVPTAEQATALFGNGYKLAEFTGVSESTMEFTTTNTFAAGVPYLVKPTASKAVTSPTVFDNVNITATTASSVEQTDGGDTYKFAGTFAPKTFAGNECATSRFVASGNKLNTPTDGSTMKALRAYFTVPASTNNARNFTIDGFEDEVITSISEEQIVKGETSSSVIYNLAGQRVAQPTKGLYIVNGKKVLVKDKR